MESTCCPVADVICRTAELGVSITGASVDEDDMTVIEARPVDKEGFCPSCGAEGRLRDHVVREPVDIPAVGHPTRLRIRLGRYRCVHDECAQRIFQQRLAAAEPGAKTTRRCTRWILQRLAIDKMSVSAVARALNLGWDLVNRLAATKIREIVYDTPGFLDGVRVLGVDEHCWRHTATGDKYVTVLIDLTAAIDGTGPSRLLDVVEGRSAKVLREWLDKQTDAFKSRVEVVTMDGFTGYHTATKETLPEAIPVLDPFHVIQLAGDKLTTCRQGIQQDTCGRRGRKGDILYRGTAHHAHPPVAADRTTDRPAGQDLFRTRRARRHRSHLPRLPGHHRRLPTPPTRRRQAVDAQDHRGAAPQGARRSGRARRTRPHPAPQTRGHPGVLRPRGRFQRT